MSGPLTGTDSAPLAVTDPPGAACVELNESRDELVGRIRVRRALPRRGRRTIGAWCFADHMGPADVDERNGLSIGAHPHIGLMTVTRLLDGQVLQRDSLATEQVIRPGQPNLMTAGHGVSHSEEGTGHFRGTVEGMQLWIAQPSSTRDSALAFEHHDELPQVEYGNAVATVLVGELGDTLSPARRDTPFVGADLALHDGSAVLPSGATGSTASSSCVAASRSTTSSSNRVSSPASARGGTSWSSTLWSRPASCCSLANRWARS